MNVTLKVARADLSRLVAAAQRGDEVVITKAGKPCVRLVPIPRARRPGSAKGRACLTLAYFDPLPEDELRAWKGR